MDWAESDSGQVTRNLQFASQQKAGSRITVTKEDGTEVFSFESDSEYARTYSGLILSHAYFAQGETYHVYIDGIQMAYTGNDMGRGPGGFGGGPGGMPFQGGEIPEGMQMPEDFDPSQFQGGQMPEGFTPGQMPGGFDPENLPEGFDPSQMGGGKGQQPEGGNRQPPEGFEGMEPPAMPEDFDPSQLGGRGEAGSTGEAQTGFYMNDKVNAFSGVTAAE